MKFGIEREPKDFEQRQRICFAWFPRRLFNGPDMGWVWLEKYVRHEIWYSFRTMSGWWKHFASTQYKEPKEGRGTDK